jgi:hypothetical protein
MISGGLPETAEALIRLSAPGAGSNRHSDCQVTEGSNCAKSIAIQAPLELALSFWPREKGGLSGDVATVENRVDEDGLLVKVPEELNGPQGQNSARIVIVACLIQPDET